ncbi:LOW QUALITY PROTEIN: hypothetical protein ACHAXN_000794 [Cyclotella atomus]
MSKVIVSTPWYPTAATNPKHVPSMLVRTVFKNLTNFTHDHVFGEDVSTSQVYTDLVQGIVSSVTKDLHMTLSGKTFTMQGADEKEGIIQYAAKDISESIKQEEHTAESLMKVRICGDIYNEELRDLLTDNKPDNKQKTNSLVIREDKKGSISVENLKEVTVRSLDRLMEVFRVGEANKSIMARQR